LPTLFREYWKAEQRPPIVEMRISLLFSLPTQMSDGTEKHPKLS